MRKHFIKIEINCKDTAEQQKVIEVINFHLETLNPQFTKKANKLTVIVPPLDSKLFEPQEACDIIRLTLAQSLYFITDWKCTLHIKN